MKRTAITVGLWTSLLATGPAVHAQVAPAAWSNPSGEAMEGLSHQTFWSPSVGADVGYSILLPPQYEAGSRRYPVVYFLHGAGGDESRSPRGLPIADVVEAMSEGRLESMIIVFPNGGLFTWYADSYNGAIPVETTLLRELIPHVDATYRTIADRANRAISGFSMGGFGALVLGLKHPTMFSSIVAYAPALVDVQGVDGRVSLRTPGSVHAGAQPRPPRLDSIADISFLQMFDESPERFAQHSPWNLTESVSAELFDQLPIRIVVGTRDFLLNTNEMFHDRLVARGYYHEFFVLKDIPHSIGQLFDRVGIDGLEFHARAGGWQ